MPGIFGAYANNAVKAQIAQHCGEIVACCDRVADNQDDGSLQPFPLRVLIHNGLV